MLIYKIVAVVAFICHKIADNKPDRQTDGQTMVGSLAQWFGRQSLTGCCSLIYA